MSINLSSFGDDRDEFEDVAFLEAQQAMLDELAEEAAIEDAQREDAGEVPCDWSEFDADDEYPW